MSDEANNLLKKSDFKPGIANANNKTSTIYALGDDGWVSGAGIDYRSWDAKNAEWAVELPAGAYALLYEVDGKQGNVWDGFGVYVGDSRVGSAGHHDGPYVQKVAFELSAASTVHVMVKCYAPARYRLMLVEGTEPAAWAPAEGETLAGGGALMSANLWDTSTENFKPDANGVYLVGKSTGELRCTITGASALAENQTVHMGASLRGSGKGALKPFVGYKDAAGNVNWVGFPAWTPTDQWQRFEGSCVVPSGMTPTRFGFNTSKATGDMEVLNPAFSYGSPVCLASSAHTPYATQDHVSVTYATQASQKILSDSITSEVNARAKTDGAVSELSSKMEQTVNGINVSLDKLTATEKQIHSWFDFGSDASGNPKLAMGSSSSPIIGEYSNTGTTYKDRSGATLLALDAANSTTGADHVVAKDMTVGKWQWVPTNGGDNLTLVWKG